jgi:hypothetical protein
LIDAFVMVLEVVGVALAITTVGAFWDRFEHGRSGHPTTTMSDVREGISPPPKLSPPPEKKKIPEHVGSAIA